MRKEFGWWLVGVTFSILVIMAVVIHIKRAGEEARESAEVRREMQLHPLIESASSKTAYEDKVRAGGFLFKKDSTWDESLKNLNKGKRIEFNRFNPDTFDDVRRFSDGSVWVFSFSKTDTSPYRLITVEKR